MHKKPHTCLLESNISLTCARTRRPTHESHRKPIQHSTRLDRFRRPVGAGNWPSKAFGLGRSFCL